MKITQEWLDSVKDERGLTPGQKTLFAVWAARLHYVGFGHLPDQVARVIEGCKGYRGMDAGLRNLLNP